MFYTSLTFFFSSEQIYFILYKHEAVKKNRSQNRRIAVKKSIANKYKSNIFITFCLEFNLCFFSNVSNVLVICY